MREDKAQYNQRKRKHTKLASWLFRECNFPSICYLMMGTVPPIDFKLAIHDIVTITIEGIGTLTNRIEIKGTYLLQKR